METVTPSQESMERAKKWLVSQQKQAGIINPNPSAGIVRSLALEFDRVRLETKAYYAQHLSDQLNCAAADLRTAITRKADNGGEV